MHEQLKHPDMPAMTMVVQVTDLTMLEKGRIGGRKYVPLNKNRLTDSYC